MMTEETSDPYPSVDTLHVHHQPSRSPSPTEPSCPHPPTDDLMFSHVAATYQQQHQHDQHDSASHEPSMSASRSQYAYASGIHTPITGSATGLHTPLTQDHDHLQSEIEWDHDHDHAAIVADVFAATHHRRSSVDTPSLPQPVTELPLPPLPQPTSQHVSWEQSHPTTTPSQTSHAVNSVSWNASSTPSPSPSPDALIGSIVQTPSALDATLSPTPTVKHTHTRQRSGVPVSLTTTPDHNIDIAQLARAPTPVIQPPFIHSPSIDHNVNPHSLEVMDHTRVQLVHTDSIDPGSSPIISPKFTGSGENTARNLPGHISGLTTALHQRQASQQGAATARSPHGLPPLPLERVHNIHHTQPLVSNTARSEAPVFHHSRSNSTGSISARAPPVVDMMIHETSPTNNKPQPHHHKSSTLPEASAGVGVSGQQNIATLIADTDAMAARGKLGRLTIVDRANPNNAHAAVGHAHHFVKIHHKPKNEPVVEPVPSKTPRPSFKKSNSTSGSSDIVVKDVERKTHVTYDPQTGKFAGLPKEWEAALKRQFGLPPTLCETMKLEPYVSRIPSILIRMQKYLYEHDGLSQVGIFRLAPDGKECEIAKEQLNNGIFESCQDVNVMANLIKVWFRDLPVPLLNQLTSELVASCTSESRASDLISTLHEPNQSIFHWLLDLAADITAKSEQNKMTAKNVAIVIAPNLYKPPTASKDPQEAMKMLTMSKHFTTFLEWSILWKSGRRQGSPR